MRNRRSIGKAVTLCVCWLLSLAAMTVSLQEAGWFSFFMQVFVPVMLIFGYLFLWKLEHAFRNWPLWILAAVFAAVVTLGASFDRVGSAELVTGQKWIALVYFIGRVPAFYMGMIFLWEAMKNRKLLIKLYPVWAYAAVIFACWIPYLAAVWPGTVSNDSITQLFQLFGLRPLSNANPLFQTGLIGLFAAVGQGIFGSADAAVALYVLVQGLLMAWLLGYTLSLIAGGGTPAWLVAASLAFYALNPVFPLFAFCVGKDTNFAMAVLWLTITVWRITRSEKPSRADVLSLSISAVLCVLLRNAGIGLVAVTLSVLLIWSLVRKNRVWEGAMYAIACSACTLFILYAALIPMLDAQESSETEIMSAPLQQVARVVANESLPQEYREAVDAVLPVDKLKAAYNGELSDPVKNLWRAEATPEQKRAFLSAWVDLMFERPTTYFSAFFHNSYGYMMPGFVSTIKPTFLLGTEGNRTPLKAAFPFSVNPAADSMKIVLKKLLTYAPFRLLAAPGLYGWVLLFAFTAVLALRQRRMLIGMLPAILTLLGCLLSPVNGYFRYAMPIYFTAPMLLAVAARAIRKSEPIAL